MSGAVSTSSTPDPPNAALDHALFRRVMGSFVTGVTVVTTQLRGEVRGMTANAFMSGSLEPPLCVVAVALKARMHAFLLEAGHFGVNILARGQESLIGHFSGNPIDGLDPKYEYVGPTPLLPNCRAAMAATVSARHACGDHTIFIGRISAMRHTEGVAPIVLHVGRLASLMPSAERPPVPDLDFW